MPDVAAAIHIIGLLEKTFDDSVQFRPELSTTMGKKWDGHSIGSLRGLKFWWQAPQPGQPGQLMMYLGGGVLSAATHEATHDVFGYLYYGFGLEFKRIDIAIDDYERAVSIDEVRAASVDDNFAYVDRSKIITEGPRKKQKGETIYFGSPKSDKLLRVYDKTIESNGEIDAIRWEAQYRDEKAHKIGSAWLSFEPKQLETDSAQFLASTVTGCVTFCDRSDDEAHIDRCPLLPWWERFLELTAKGVRIIVARKKPLLEDTFNWLNRQVFPGLAMVKNILADGFQSYIDSEIAGGEKRQNSRHKAIIEQSKHDGWGLA